MCKNEGYIKNLELENYKLNYALRNMKLALELQQIILDNTLKNEKGEETCTVKFDSVCQLATYLSAMNMSLITSADYYLNRPIEEIAKEVESILNYKP